MDALHGLLSGLPWWGHLLCLAGVSLGLGFVGSPFYAWTAGLVVTLWVLGAPLWFTLMVAVVMIAFNIPALRQNLVSANIMRMLQKMKLLPAISETEKVALEAGSTWVDGELFSGKPNFEKLMTEPYQKLSEKEQKFLDGPCEQLCRLMNNEKAYEDGDLPREVWDFMKREKFLGLIIPEEFGGLGFTALGHSEVISKLGTCSIPLAISVMVPNSLGPAELLIHYGTDKQKNYYLPRLARGEEIPCFGLTEPQAGSDAGSMQSTAILFKGDDGKLHLKINWRKRYITLGAVSTVLGLAVKLLDPDKLLGRGTDIGITCVLVPSTTKGVVLGKRHDPLGVPFYNCPVEGHDVVVSVEQIIGGLEGAGHGWRMLMECLAAGRSISLPAQSVGGAKKVARIVGAYAQVRQQFGMPIGKFEGVGEVMARIGGLTYALEACRIYTVGAVDKGLKPAVVSAIAKYQTTELSRRLVNDAMDICGGAGISQGPRNLLAQSYIAAPIGITVEGANILTRTMIIFGQGAIRCHPFAYKEVQAVANNDVAGFDKAFWGHVRHIVRNACRAFLLSITRGRLARVPASPMAPYYRKLAWTSASFAIMADVAMGSLGGALKFKEKITGRFADILGWMYLITATLRRYEAEGRRKDHEAFVEYSVRFGFNEIQKAFDGLFANLEMPVVGKWLLYPISVWSRLNVLAREASDATGDVITKAMMTPGELRDSLTLRALYLPREPEAPMGRLEHAFVLSYEAQAVHRKISKAVREKVLPKGRPDQLVAEARNKGVITSEEAEILSLAKDACADAIEVDSFKLEDYKKGKNNVVESQKPAAASKALASNA